MAVVSFSRLFLRQSDFCFDFEGKTTIIECLKMACTGTLPPTCSQGQSFINDPGMTNTTEVKAHIKMRFNNQAGMITISLRSH